MSALPECMSMYLLYACAYKGQKKDNHYLRTGVIDSFEHNIGDGV